MFFERMGSQLTPPERLPDVQPFDEIVRDHGSLVLRVCRALLDPVDAEDAWSETFLAALRASATLPTGDALEPWLVTVARRKAVDVLRRRARDPVPTETLPDAGVPAADMHEDLYAALASLPEKQRLCVTYHHLGGLPHREVAALVGGTEVAARRAASDGMRTLRTRLDREGALS
jgi:RNA polymerase sigma factor (sigma-70 family)